ncbi:uncharacterized protein BP01DRAFT_396757 [Aspergillus saccharolyticus JOP 1030-1]|uniref:Uncharacterized protein n=1 Tax=Aspergillus saccharolyticus JOP 1030-1 TaxID=1450539 RepID=A0A318ZRC6_9EURO|nr:hypothetical protein BP01DRAFT_396757 [Aspergillus saccharolyticus JOP 1030-1]PYH50086.1 hypothetical protein BP01DRAFT_396757 [Aspergillus saccharolyticus JOP 1030-1]
MLSVVSKSSSMPGLSYYVRAMELLSAFPERPTIKHIEFLLMLVCCHHSPYLIGAKASALPLAFRPFAVSS